MTGPQSARPTDAALRLHHEFVSAFETLRKSFGYREMGDDALRYVAEQTDVQFEDLRVARHLRNAVAHDEPVNVATLRKYLDILTSGERLDMAEDDACVRSVRRPGAWRAFRIHAWKDDRLEREMLSNGYVSMGSDELGDLSSVRDPETIRTELLQALPDRTSGAIGIFVGYWKRYLWEATAGDIVVLPTQDKAVAIGEFVSRYFYVDTAEPRARHRREVAWSSVGVPRSDLGIDLLKVINGKHTIQEFKQVRAAERLQAICDHGADPGP